jgi:acyl-coenzyme A synthetase/AMP-(fatty) acid ligase
VFAGIEELPPATVRTYGADGAELLGQAIKAFVVPERSVDLTARAVQLHCQARLESFMVPKYIEIVAALPRTDTGKISKIGLG